MKSLWLKDRPWMVGFLLLGTLVMSIAIAERSFVGVFIVSPGRLEMAFYTAAVAGLLLGIVATLWDDMLGTREFLTQRPVDAKFLAMSPLAACAAVLLGWMLLVPIGAWLFAAYWEGYFDLSCWSGIPEIYATIVVAVPMCAIACTAALLPKHWLVRVFFLGVCAPAVAGGILEMSRYQIEDSSRCDMGLLVVLSLLTAAALFTLAWLCSRRRYDLDQPWPRHLRLSCGITLAGSLSYLVVAGASATQSSVIRELHLTYPMIVEVDGSLELALHGEKWRQRIPCDRNHVATGPVQPHSQDAQWSYTARSAPELIDLEAPRFHRSHQMDSLDGRTLVIVDHRGRSYLLTGRTSRLLPTGIGREHGLLPPSGRLTEIRDIAAPTQGCLLYLDLKGGSAWQFDREEGHFAALALPGDDRIRTTGHYYKPQNSELLAEIPLFAGLKDVFRNGSSFVYLVGKKGAYALRNGELVPFEVPVRKSRQFLSPEVEITDALNFTVSVAKRGDRAGFEHHFEPRTLIEQLHAAHAMAWSVVRPVPLQLASTFLADDQTKPYFWNDQLLADGRRIWLLIVGLAMAAGMSLLVHRRLVRIGANQHARRFWVVTTALTGVVGWLLAILCERPRSYARPQLQAASTPRIVSRTSEEIPA